jgi:hypothetical protein
MQRPALGFWYIVANLELEYTNDVCTPLNYAFTLEALAHMISPNLLAQSFRDGLLFRTTN